MIRKSTPEEDVYRREAQGGDGQRGSGKKVLKPSQRKEMAKESLDRHQTSIRVLCEAFGISQTCYRYENKLSEENKLIIDWLQSSHTGSSPVGLSTVFFVFT